MNTLYPSHTQETEAEIFLFCILGDNDSTHTFTLFVINSALCNNVSEENNRTADKTNIHKLKLGSQHSQSAWGTDTLSSEKGGCKESELTSKSVDFIPMQAVPDRWTQQRLLLHRAAGRRINLAFPFSGSRCVWVGWISPLEI